MSTSAFSSAENATEPSHERESRSRQPTVVDCAPTGRFSLSEDQSATEEATVTEKMPTAVEILSDMQPLVTNCSINDTGSLEPPTRNHLVMDENVESYTQKHPFHPGHRGLSILSSVTSTPDSLQSPIGGSTGLSSSDIY